MNGVFFVFVIVLMFIIVRIAYMRPLQKQDVQSSVNVDDPILWGIYESALTQPNAQHETMLYQHKLEN